MTAHWIDVIPAHNDPDRMEWKLCAEVVGFKALSGAHTGDNLGRTFVGLCDRIGIIQPTKSKVSE